MKGEAWGFGLKRNVEMVETALAPRLYRWANWVAHAAHQKCSGSTGRRRTPGAWAGDSVRRTGGAERHAQPEYDLQAIVGAEQIARGDLANAVGAYATADQIPTPAAIGDTVD